jgi:hypothetical protein
MTRKIRWTSVERACCSANAAQLLERIALLELAPPVLARALEPFPVPVGTLHALHLASIEFIRAQGRSISLASYDERMVESARKLGVPILPL